MKKRIFIPLLLGCVLFFCTSSGETEQWIPVFMERGELEQSVLYLNEGREMKIPVKSISAEARYLSMRNTKASTSSTTATPGRPG